MLVCRPDLAVIYIKGLSTHIVQMTLTGYKNITLEGIIYTSYLYASLVVVLDLPLYQSGLKKRMCCTDLFCG